MPTKTAQLDRPDSHAATAVLQVAERLYAMEPEWVVFFREVLGVEGIVRRTFSDPEALMRFECSPQYARIREMLDGLRTRQTRPAGRAGKPAGGHRADAQVAPRDPSRPRRSGCG